MTVQTLKAFEELLLAIDPTNSHLYPLALELAIRSNEVRICLEYEVTHIHNHLIQAEKLKGLLDDSPDT